MKAKTKKAKAAKPARDPRDPNAIVYKAKIDDNVPVPPSSRGGRKYDFPFADLKPGKSFFHPLPDGLAMTSFLSVVTHAAKRAKVKVTKRRVCEGGSVGVRVWRM